MRKTAVVTLILTGLLTLGVFCIQPIKAEYQGSITINADGSISPSTAPIEQIGNIYTLTSDTTGSITINSNNTVLDGRGYTLVSNEHDDESGIVALSKVSNVTVKNFIILFSEYKKTIGISLAYASNVIVANNTITGFDSIQAWNGGTYTGIYVVGGNSNTITQNNLMYNLNGMEFLSSSYNLIVQNNITGTSKFDSHGGLYSTGIYFGGRASNNTIYHNNFADNIYQAKVSDSINAWDDGYLGNYWSDYKAKYPYAAEIDNSGIGNVPYVIDEQNKDWYPLLQPFDSALYAPKIPPKISILSPVNQVFNESSVPLLFTVDKQTVWIGYSLDGQDNVTISGNTTITDLPNGLHNVTVYARDEFDNMGASETISFSVAEEPEPFPTAPVLAAAATLAIACIAILVYFKKRRATNLKRNLSPN